MLYEVRLLKLILTLGSSGLCLIFIFLPWMVGASLWLMTSRALSFIFYDAQRSLWGKLPSLPFLYIFLLHILSGHSITGCFFFFISFSQLAKNVLWELLTLGLASFKCPFQLCTEQTGLLQMKMQSHATLRTFSISAYCYSARNNKYKLTSSPKFLMYAVTLNIQQ